MKTTSIVLLLLATLGGAAYAEIDFNPAPGERVLEGIKFSQLFFHQNGRKISYEQPRGWTYSADSSRIRFTPPEVPQAFAEIAQTPLLQPEVLNEEATTRLQFKVMSSVPPNSTGAALVSAEKNPLMIAEHETFEVTISYKLYGEDYSQSVLFMNLQDMQLTFRFVSRKRDFPKLHQAFRGSLCSLQWL